MLRANPPPSPRLDRLHGCPVDPSAPKFTIHKRADDPAEGALWDQLMKLTARFERPMADAIEEAFVELYRQADIDALERAIAIGSVEQVLTILGLDDFASTMTAAREVLRDAVIAAARAEAPRVNGAALLTAYGAGTGVGRAAVGAVGAAIATRIYNDAQELYIEQLRELNTTGLPALSAPVVPPAPPALPPGGSGGLPPRPTPSFAPKTVIFQFDSLNPKVTDFLQRYQMDLIVEIDDKTRSAIKAVVTKGMMAGQNPRETARDVRQIVGLTERQAAAVGAYRKQLETFHERKSANRMNLGGKISRAPGGAQTFAVDASGKPVDGILDRRLRDFRYDSQLQRAMTTGKALTPAQIDKMVEGYARKYRRYRSEMIARTESMRALNAGVLESWKQAVDQGLVQENLLRKQWIVAKDERTCPICRPMPALNRGAEGFGIRVTEQFNTGNGYGVMLPGLHPGCRCVVFIRMIEQALAAA